MITRTKISHAAGAIIEKDGKVLLVKETKAVARGQWSHPCGHLEISEDPIDAVKREVKEETGLDFEPKNILGVYSLSKTEADGTIHHVIKIIFIGDISENKVAELAEDVSEARWFTPEEIEKMDSNTLRDLDIKKMVKDYFFGKKYPLDILTHTIQSK